MEKAIQSGIKAATQMTNFRWNIAFLIFLISFTAYMDRV
jgi:ACS family glucarate transporter-like MFS transporter